MQPHENLSLPLRFLRVFLLLIPVVGLLIQNIEVAAAPITSCDSLVYTCPEVDSNGFVLIVDSYAVSPKGPYSIFDCVYVRLLSYSSKTFYEWNECRYGIPKTQTEPHTCRYYKVPLLPFFCLRLNLIPLSLGIWRIRTRP